MSLFLMVLHLESGCELGSEQRLSIPSIHARHYYRHSRERRCGSRQTASPCWRKSLDPVRKFADSLDKLANVEFGTIQESKGCEYDDVSTTIPQAHVCKAKLRVGFPSQLLRGLSRGVHAMASCRKCLYKQRNICIIC